MAAKVGIVDQTAVFKACQEGDLNYLRQYKGQKLDLVDKSTDNKLSILHIAAKNGHLPVVQFLIRECHYKHWNPERSGRTPLSYACEYGHLPVVKYLVTIGSNPDQRDGYQFPLHIAARCGHLPVVEYLVKEAKCDTEVESDEWKAGTPLHIASRRGNLSVVEFLVKESRCKVECTDSEGKTPLHNASENGHLPVVECLVKEAKCNTESTDENNETPLYLAIRSGHLPVVEYLVKEAKCKVDCTNVWKKSPLHLASSCGNLSVVELLVKEAKCDVEHTNDGQTPLHNAIINGHLPVVEFLVKEAKCNVERTDEYNDTPLHLAIKCEHQAVAEFLVKEAKCNIESLGSWGLTPLHFACRKSGQNSHLVYYPFVEFLLENNANPNAIDYSGKSILEDLAIIGLYHDATNVIQLLLKYGAKPTYEEWETYLNSKEHAAQNTIKAYIVGDPGAGKSSLTKALKIQNKGLSSLKNRVVKMSGIDEKTAGIVPHELCNEKFGRVTLLDFAGHKEYYAAHDAVMRSSLDGSQSAVFFIVIDLTHDIEKFKSNILYWLSFIENQYSSDNLKPHVIVVGSHADRVNAANLSRKTALVKSLEDGGSFDKFQKASQLFNTVDCRYAKSSSLSKLRSVFSEVCQSLQHSQDVSFASHWYLIFLLDKFRDHKAIKLGDLLAESFDFSQDLDSMVESCEQLSAYGNLLFLKNKQCLENSWIVLDKPALLTRVHGSIFAPEGFQEHHQFATITGVVPFSKLVAHFSDLDSNLLAHFLCHLEFCHEVTDPEILALLQATSSNRESETPPSKERYFFFPGLVCLNMPGMIWQPNSAYSYHSGWFLKCLKPEHFFTSRFVQVLLLRLAFAFSLEPTASSTRGIPALERKCSVWKNGISWSDRSGVNVLVEVPDQKQVVLLLRCHPLQESTLVEVRSSIMHTILDTKKEFCPKIIVEESFLQPQDAVQYPFEDAAATAKLITMMELAIVISEGRRFAVLDSGEQVDVEKLLFFEPYADLGESILSEIFDTERPDYHEEIRDKFLYSIADKAVKKTDIFFKLLKTSQTRLDNLLDMAPPGETHKFVRIFQIWRDAQEEGSLSDLRKTFDKFSVFAGRNPLKICHP